MKRRELFCLAATLAVPSAPSLEALRADVDAALNAYLANPFSALAAWRVRRAAARARRAMETHGVTPDVQNEYEMVCGLRLVEAFNR
ncbi:MAG: hypothetical protein JO323_08380 [Acidobacteriia bacterium]|nr:hypothetical protein [Terriglobia bacterium]